MVLLESTRGFQIIPVFVKPDEESEVPARSGSGREENRTAAGPKRNGASPEWLDKPLLENNCSLVEGV
jgi:hypothetical protein